MLYQGLTCVENAYSPARAEDFASVRLAMVKRQVDVTLLVRSSGVEGHLFCVSDESAVSQTVLTLKLLFLSRQLSKRRLHRSQERRAQHKVSNHKYRALWAQSPRQLGGRQVNVNAGLGNVRIQVCERRAEAVNVGGQQLVYILDARILQKNRKRKNRTNINSPCQCPR
jgi:hypothetical protein